VLVEEIPGFSTRLLASKENSKRPTETSAMHRLSSPVMSMRDGGVVEGALVYHKAELRRQIEEVGGLASHLTKAAGGATSVLAGGALLARVHD
jgi:hypothetical protein